MPQVFDFLLLLLNFCHVVIYRILYLQLEFIPLSRSTFVVSGKLPLEVSRHATEMTGPF